MKKTAAIHAFATAAIANGLTSVEGEEERDTLWYLRPTHMEMQMQKQHRYQGCKNAGCRTFKDCICRCKDCTRWCKYRGVTIRDEDGTVFIRFASGKLIVFMPREEYDNIKVHWEKLGLKLEPPGPVEALPDGVTPV